MLIHLYSFLCWVVQRNRLPYLLPFLLSRCSKVNHAPPAKRYGSFSHVFNRQQYLLPQHFPPNFLLISGTEEGSKNLAPTCLAIPSPLFSHVAVNEMFSEVSFPKKAVRHAAAAKVREKKAIVHSDKIYSRCGKTGRASGTFPRSLQFSWSDITS